MMQVFKILSGRDKVKRDTWFKMASDSTVNVRTRAAADPLALKIPVNRLNERKHFFSQRVPEQWNKIPLEIRGAATAAGFEAAYAAHCRDMAATAS